MMPVFLGLLVLAVSSNLVLAEAPKPVQAELKKESVWAGEGMPLVITLFSPGPFSGTASFDFPELQQTVFLAEGSPLVGSEVIDGETYFTQRHEFTIYTQRSGEIEIPAFQVRFTGKKTFTSKAEPVQGTTQSIKFRSKRPPGLASNEIAIAADSMDISESWSPASLDHLTAGDVIERRITRNATGTTAMMLPPIQKNAPDGIRVYLTDPVVVDRNERGSRQAVREEVLKYQFERPGTFTLPELTFKWWSPKSENFQQIVFEERTVTIARVSPARASIAEPDEQHSWFWMIVLLSGCLASWFFRNEIRSEGVRLWKFLYSEEAQAAALVLRNCRSNDPAATYSSVLNWMSISGFHRQSSLILHDDFQQEWSDLSQSIYGKKADEQEWSGTNFAFSFRKLRRTVKQTIDGNIESTSLPPINPHR